jgi:dienelactone hydrolase
MKYYISPAIGFLIASFLFISCNSNEKKSELQTLKLKEENITYQRDSITMDGFVVYDENKKGPRPAIIIVPEWWGLNDYIKMRARKLAELGYFAMAIDMYGNGKTADNPTDASNLASPFYQVPQMAKSRFDAALEKMKTYSQVDQNNIAAIGYCFGGTMVLNMAKLGDDLKGVVSFHGVISNYPGANKDLLKAKILVCHGGDDQFTPQKDIDEFKKQMDSINADYTFKIYPGATHSFTNPNSTAMGEKFKIPIAYNKAADTTSWNDMKDFFNRIFK